MSEEDNDIVTLEVQPKGFERRNVGITALERALKKHSKTAVSAIVQVMLSTKDEALKVKCAEIIAKLHMQVSKEISDDQFKRLIADVKFNGTKMLTQQKGEDEDNEENNDDDMPILDFSNIRSVDMD